MAEWRECLVKGGRGDGARSDFEPLPLAPSESLAPGHVPVPAVKRIAVFASTLRHVVVRRGPPAFV